MKRKELEIGSTYVARVSGVLTTVRLDGIREASKYRPATPDRTVEVFDVTNLRTGRKLVFRSAQKFRFREAVATKGGA